MHVNPEKINLKRGPKHRAPEKWEVKVLALISEHGAIPMDLLALFLGLTEEQASQLMKQFARRRWVMMRKFLIKDKPWVWLRKSGVKHANTGLGYKVPDISSLPHRRAICVIRLRLEEQYPEGEWICERRLAYRRFIDGHVPDGLFRVRNSEGKMEEWAIEVELSPKERTRYIEISEDRNFRYDKLKYYCTPVVWRALNRIPEIARNEIVTIQTVFKDSRRVSNFEWQWSATSGPGERPTYDRLEGWEIDILRLLSEQTAIPMDQLARFLACSQEAAQKVVDHLDEAGFVSQGYGPVGDPAWVWLTKIGARLSGTGLSLLIPATTMTLEYRRRNEARLYIMERDPYVRIWGRRLLCRGAEDRRVPLYVLEEGEEQHAVEVECSSRTSEELIEKYDRRCSEFTCVAVFCPKRRLQKFDRLKKTHGWDNMFVYPFEGKHPTVDDPLAAPSKPVLLYEVTFDELPDEALEEVRKAEKMMTAPQLEWMGRYRGRGFARWRLITESGKAWHVSRTPQGWFARRTTEKDEPTVTPETLEERAAPDPEPEPEKRVKGPTRGMRKISARELPEEALEAIRKAASLGTAPEVKAVKQRRGGGFRRWLVDTSAGMWRVAESPQHGFNAKLSDGTNEQSVHYRKSRWRKDPPGTMEKIGTWEVPFAAIDAIQKAGDLPWPPKVLEAERRRRRGAPRWRLVTDFDTWRVTLTNNEWTASLSQ